MKIVSIRTVKTTETVRMTPDSPEMSFFSVVSFVLSIYHKITEKISPKIGYLGNCTDGEIREDAGSDEKGGKTGVEKTCMEGQRELAAPAVVHSGAARIHSVQLYSDSCFNPDPIQGL
ncbi:MAG: hypothetical protein ACLUN5_09695 [Oscillospiraceae bacterium]